MKKIDSVTGFNKDRGQKTLHPLVTVLDQSQSHPVKEERCISDLYIIFLKDEKCAEMLYGRGKYDYEEGTLLFLGPGQVFGFGETGNMVQPTGWALAFHPDLLRGTHLARHIHDYGFFSYNASEALHVSDAERAILLECLGKIRNELSQPIDKHSRTLIVNNIELFLNYCVRFYDRQFITREYLHKDLLSGFEHLLQEYFQSGRAQRLGLPTVAYCAAELHLSAKYFGDLIKKETGISAQEFIQNKVVSVAKERIFNLDKSISEVAYDLGFRYPQHFTRLFKQKVGVTPNEYRRLN